MSLPSPPLSAEGADGVAALDAPGHSGPHFDAQEMAAILPAPLPPPGESGQCSAPLPISTNPRATLMLLWCVWLMGSWAVSLTYGWSAIARPMIMSVVFGLMIAWPTLRLSQYHLLPKWQGQQWKIIRPTAEHIVRSVLRDWLALNLVLQAVIWPLWLTSKWSIVQTLWLSLAIAAWSLLSAAFVAMGCRSEKMLVRSLYLMWCLLIVFGETLAMLLYRMSGRVSGQVRWNMRISPLDTIWTLTSQENMWSVEPLNWQILSAGIAAIVAWIIAIIRTYQHMKKRNIAGAARAGDDTGHTKEEWQEVFYHGDQGGTERGNME